MSGRTLKPVGKRVARASSQTLAEAIVISCAALSLLGLTLPVVMLTRHVDDPGTRSADLRTLHVFLSAAMQDGSLDSGGPFAAGDVLKSRAGDVQVPNGMSGDIGTADFCVQGGGLVMTRGSRVMVRGHCEGLIMRRLPQ